MKKIICAVLVLSMISISTLFTGFAESAEEFFYSFEAEDGTIYPDDGTVTGLFKKTPLDYGASGNYAVVSYKVNSEGDAQNPEEQPLKFEEFIEEGGKYKVFVRIKGRGTVKYSVNGGGYKSVYNMAYKTDEYGWAFLGDVELNEYDYNTIAFSSRLVNLYLDKIILTNSKLYYPVGFGQTPEEGNGLSLVYPVPERRPASSHPRVMINSSHIERLKENLNHNENASAYKRLLSDAKRSQTGILSKPSSSVSGNYSLHALDCAEANALLYLLEGDEARAEKAISIMTNYMETLIFNASYEGTPLEIRGRGAGIFTAALVYDWCHDAECFTAEQKERFMYAILSQAEQLDCGWPPLKLSAFDNGMGLENSVIKDMLAFAIAVADEYPDIYNMVAGRVFEEYVPVVNHHYEKESLFHRMGDDYGVFRFEYEVYLNMLLSAMGHPDVISENQHMTAYQHIIRRRPDGARLQEGDIYSYPGNLNDVALSFWAASLFNDSYLKQQFAEQMPKPWEMTHEIMNNLSNALYLVYNNPGIIRKPLSDLPLSVYGGDESGVMTVRNSNERAKEDNQLIISMKTPEMFYGSHAHLDAGSFYIYYKGPLAVDSGMYQSDSWKDENGNKVTDLAFGSVHDYNYNKRTIAHNSMLIYDPSQTDFGIYGNTNDGGQNPFFSYNSGMTAEDYIKDEGKGGTVISRGFGDDENRPSYTYLKGDITGWYNNSEKNYKKVESFERSFLFWNFFDEKIPGALIVFDSVTSADEDFKKTWLLHSQNEPDVSGNTVAFANDGGGMLKNYTLLPKNSKTEIIGGSGSEYTVNGVQYNAVPLREQYDESGNYRAEISPLNPSLTDEFLNVMVIADEDCASELPVAELLEAEDFYGASLMGKTAFFPKGKGLKSGSFSLRVDNENNEEITVTGLSHGSWLVTVNGIKKTYKVTEKVNVLNFPGTSGEYHVEKLDENGGNASVNIFDNIREKKEPFVSTFKESYEEGISSFIYADSFLPKGYEITGYGVIAGALPESEKTDEGVLVFESEKEPDTLGRFGIRIDDKKGVMRILPYVRAYVDYIDGGISKTVYGNVVRRQTK